MKRRRTHEQRRDFLPSVRARSAEHKLAIAATRIIPGQMVSFLRQQLDERLPAIILLRRILWFGSSSYSPKRSSLTRPGDPLFDDLAAKVGVDLALIGPSNRLAQSGIRNPFLPGKALKPSGLDDSHFTPESLL